jgi:hypothetical protein
MKVVFDGGLLEHVGPKKTAQVLMQLLKALVECNLAYLEKHPNTPHPYKANVRYAREKHGEQWKSIPKVIQDGEGDCEDLASYLAAFLAFHGKKPVALVLRWRTLPSNGRLFHVLVRGPDGIEDPSKRLGM